MWKLPSHRRPFQKSELADAEVSSVPLQATSPMSGTIQRSEHIIRATAKRKAARERVQCSRQSPRYFMEYGVLYSQFSSAFPLGYYGVDDKDIGRKDSKYGDVSIQNILRIVETCLEIQLLRKFVCYFRGLRPVITVQAYKV